MHGDVFEGHLEDVAHHKSISAGVSDASFLEQLLTCRRQPDVAGARPTELVDVEHLVEYLAIDVGQPESDLLRHSSDHVLANHGRPGNLVVTHHSGRVCQPDDSIVRLFAESRDHLVPASVFSATNYLWHFVEHVLEAPVLRTYLLNEVFFRKKPGSQRIRFVKVANVFKPPFGSFIRVKNVGRAGLDAR